MQTIVRFVSVAIALACVLFCTAVGLADAAGRVAASGGGWTVKTSDGLAVTFAKDATIAGVAIDGRELPLRGKGGFYVTEVLPPNGQRKAYGLVTGRIKPTKVGVTITARVAEGLDLSASIGATDHLSVGGTVFDTTDKDRAVIVEFVLPVDCTGWTYENTPLQKQVLAKDTQYPSIQQPDTVLASDTSPPDERQLVRLDMGRLPFNAVHNREVGLSFGILMSQPRIFLMSADPRGLVMRFNLGISPVTKNFPSKASFNCFAFRSDPTWGIRSAAERFYKSCPWIFASKANTYGNFRDMDSITTKLADKKDFGISYGEGDFQWTDGRFRPAVVPVVDELGLTVFHWREPWSWFDAVPQQMTVQDEKARLQEEAKQPKEGKSHGQYCGAPLGLCAQAALNAVMENENGEMSRVRYEYGCWMLAVNLDPDLPHPNRADIALDWQYRWLKQWDDPAYKGPRNYAWDSSTGWTGQHLLNYRRDHFKTVDNPLTFDGRTGRLCQLKALHDWSFAKVHAEMVRKKGGLICANTSPMAALLYGQYMDVLVREEPATNIHDDTGIVLRMLAYRKPVAYYQPPENAKGVRLAMFYGFAPGIDATKEEMRPIAKQYMPIIETIDRAGWEPVTRARGDGLAIERYGRKPGDLYFTVRVDGKKPTEPRESRLQMDMKGLGLDPEAVSIEEIAEKREVSSKVEGDSLAVQFDIGPDETLVFAVRAATTRSQARDASTLIDKLQDIVEGGIGYMPTITGGEFLPLGTGRSGMLLLGQSPPVPSTTMCELVKCGAAAVPSLIAHVDDDRATKIAIGRGNRIGMMFFNDEYDFNGRTSKESPQGVNRELGRQEQYPGIHTVTVGDLCFVALGQIVNRHFNAVRYQPTACIMINSPTYSQALCKTIRKEWGGLTPEQHKASLVRDFLEPDGEGRRIGACLRLGYYYPDVLEPLALKQLAEPWYDVTEVQELLRKKLYRTNDAKHRRGAFDAFIAERGEIARQGILVCLFDDLRMQEADEQGRTFPPAKAKYAARACLVELYGYPTAVKSQDAPQILPQENGALARVIDVLTLFPSEKVDQAVRGILRSTQDDTLKKACRSYLARQTQDIRE